MNKTAVLIVLALLTAATMAPARGSRGAAVRWTPPAPRVIPGWVMAVHGTTAMVLTPERRASCNITPPLTPTPCPLFIVAGLTFRVDTARAVFETASSGAQLPGKLAAGDRVVLVGTNQATNRSTGVHTLRASVIEHLATCRAPVGPRGMPSCAIAVGQ
jgi:hypothetical protein